MVEESHSPGPAEAGRKRKLGKKKGKKSDKRHKVRENVGNKFKIDGKMRKLFKKRAREYNSDDDNVDEDNSTAALDEEENVSLKRSTNMRDEESFEDAEENGRDGNGGAERSEDYDDGGILPGITKFSEGCRAFKMAFRSIIKKTIPEESLGPVLSAHKKLIAEKLAEEEAEKKTKGEAKREKQMVAEKGHVKPAAYLDSHEKFLVSIGTKGVVKLFNAVNKAQVAQRGLNPLRSKDAKAIRKQRKEAFFSELGKTSLPGTSASAKLHSAGDSFHEGPAWAPLRDSYMLTNSKLKDWDKMPNATTADEIGSMSEDGTSDDD